MLLGIKTSSLLSEYQRFTRDTTAANQAVGKERMNHYYLFLLSEANNYITEKTKYGDAKDGQRSYLLYPDYIKMKTVRVKIANIWYPLEIVWSLEKWHERTSQTGASAEGSIPTHCIVINDQGNLHLELDPVPDANGTDNIEIIYEGYQDPLTFPTDYVTGTISLTQGAAGVSGAGSSWTSSLEGRFLQPTGGKYWYEVKSVIGVTSLSLVNYFQEASLSGVAYAIAELPRLPSEFHYTPLWGAVMDYYAPNNLVKSKEFEAKYARELLMLQDKYKSKTTGRVTPGRLVGSRVPYVPRNYPKSAIG